MEYYRRFRQQLLGRIVLIILLDNALLIAGWWLATSYTALGELEIGAILAVVGIVLSVVLATANTGHLSKPTQLITDAVLHVSPDTADKVPAPDPTTAPFGRELVASLVHNVFELATVAEQQRRITTGQANNFAKDFVASSLPLPLIITNAQSIVVFANEVAGVYIGTPAKEMIGQNLYDILDMLFPSEDTLDKWLESTRDNSVTASNS